MRAGVCLVCCLAALAAPAIGAAALWHWWDRPAPPCEVFALGEPVVAPGGVARAFWRREACGDGGFVTTLHTAIAIVDADGASPREVARIAGTDGPQAGVELRWHGPEVLELRLTADFWVRITPHLMPGLSLMVTRPADTLAR